MSSTIDLRSDTMTRPTAAMRRAIAEAEVGDDVWGEDPSVRALQARVAELLGKEQALFVPSGTMANQIALLVHTRRGDEVLGAWGSHCANYEAGAAAAWAGIQFTELGDDGALTAAACAAAIRPRDLHSPRTSLIWLENTHNRGGGRILPQAEAESISSLARGRGLGVHLDGARLLNAAAATGIAPAKLAAPADSASICLSKGLGAPVGSVLAGSEAFIERARRLRKMLGGGMRQAGVLAAAGTHALEHHVARLVEDHDNARSLAERLAPLPQIALDPRSVATNIVVFDLVAGPDAAALATRCAERGVLLSLFGPRRLRAVTHLDVDAAACARAADVIAAALAS